MATPESSILSKPFFFAMRGAHSAGRKTRNQVEGEQSNKKSKELALGSVVIVG
jgi:hypothetical protein